MCKYNRGSVSSALNILHLFLAVLTEFCLGRPTNIDYSIIVNTRKEMAIV